MASAREVSFTELGGVAVHYDRDPGAYGTKGRPYVFKCQKKLRDTLDDCFTELFTLLPAGRPSVITSAGTIGDNENAHGQGLAFDLDGLFWDDTSLLMTDFFSQKYLYLGINAHLYLYFSQVLNFYYPQHHDHFHVDFNFSFRYRRESNAQTFFLQACLKYIFDEPLGHSGRYRDGVDGVHGETTRRALSHVLANLQLGESLDTKEGWFAFLKIARQRSFERVAAGDQVSSLSDARLHDVFLSANGAIEQQIASFIPAASVTRSSHTLTAERARSRDEAMADVAACVCGVLVAARKSCAADKAPSEIGYRDADELWRHDGRKMVRCLQTKGYSLAVDDGEILSHFNKPIGAFQAFLLKRIKL